jgi:transglutaminase-like putative cysteine protease
MFKRIAILSIILLSKQIVIGQTPDEVKRLFPGQEAAYLNYNQVLKLSIQGDTPVAESNHNIDLMILSEKNAPLYNQYKIYHSDYAALTTMDAYTMVPDGSKYQKVKITNQSTSGSNGNDVFYDDAKETAFDFASLTQNVIEHVEYSLFHKDDHLLVPFYFPSNLPIVNGSFIVEVPDDITINYVVKNDPTGIFVFSSEKKKKSTIYKWTLNNVKPVEDWTDAPGSDYYVPHIIIYITSYNNKKGPQHFLSSVDDLYNWDAGFLKDLNKTEDPDLKKVVDSVTLGHITQIDKAYAIYHWVQQNIKYVAFENGLEGFRPRQAAEVCRKRYGDCKDMSSIITQMLRMAGIKAYYTLIGARDLPYDYTDLPLPLVDNHMICTANIDAQWIFLDGTDPKATFGTPPAVIQDKQALIAINDKEYKILRVPVTSVDKNLITDSTFIHFTDNGIKGHENVNYYGYFGEEVYSTLSYSDDNELKDYVKTRMGKASNKFILGDYKINKIDSLNNIANISADFEIQGYGQKVGDEYYVNLNLEKLFENEMIDTVKRKVPKEEDFEYTIKEYHVLDIPKGYTVTYLPGNFNFDNDLVSIKMYYLVKNGKVIAAQEIQNKKLLINTTDFAEWNKAMKGVQPQYKESIVLGKQ